jgi:hypothetical protein
MTLTSWLDVNSFQARCVHLQRKFIEHGVTRVTHERDTGVLVRLFNGGRMTTLKVKIVFNKGSV